MTTDLEMRMANHRQTTTGLLQASELVRRYGCGPIPFVGTENAFYDRHLVFDRVIDPAVATARERFEAFARSIRDILAQRWVLTKKTYEQKNPKRIYYLSMEFLIGRSTTNNISNLLLDPLIKQAADEKGLDWVSLLEEEPDAGLGNGGLGRLAACFLDSMATMQLPATGYGLRYEGMFRQSIVNGWQKENADHWLRESDPWEIARPVEKVEVKLNCSIQVRGGQFEVVTGRPSSLYGIPFDRPVVGYGGKTVNTMRLWAAAAPEDFDFQEFGSGDFIGALGETLEAESLTRVLYPDDSTTMGRRLRFVQEYFLVACSVADIVRRFRRLHNDWDKLPDKVAMQMNDTHPALAVAELMRILLDDAHLNWDDAWSLTRRTLAYTNHTLLPEALEKWPVEGFEGPGAEATGDHLRNQPETPGGRPQAFSRGRGPRGTRELGRGGRRAQDTNGQPGHCRFAQYERRCGCPFEALRTSTVKDLAGFPERFNNKTNGVTPRRWLLQANPGLASVITAAIGEGWITDLRELSKLKALAGDPAFRDAFLASKAQAKSRFASWLKATSGRIVDPHTVFDCQVKRIHEYKRQLLNALRIVVEYNRLRDNPNLEVVPRTYFFAGKAAPAYRLAKLIIKFINNLAETIDSDPVTRGRINIVFLPEYNVSLAEKLIPASDVSNQISTAGFEASGTSNMKFMMNGALTVGTRDGATIEMAEEAGEDNLFLFGLTVEQVEGGRGWYSPSLALSE